MDRFVVGTGRCGSTLLSRMLAGHPALLSVFEFFNGLDMTKRFGAGPVDGEAFAALISQEHPFVTMVLSRGYDVEEITYPFGPKARYTRDQGLPWLLVSTLPRLTDDPDELFDETLAFARTLPARELPEQYRALFEWWARRLGRAALRLLDRLPGPAPPCVSAGALPPHPPGRPRDRALDARARCLPPCDLAPFPARGQQRAIDRGPSHAGVRPRRR
jgi:hypothetical protein